METDPSAPPAGVARPGTGFESLVAAASRSLAAADTTTMRSVVKSILADLAQHAAVDGAFVVIVDGDTIRHHWNWIDPRYIRLELSGSLDEAFGALAELMRAGLTIPIDDLHTIEIDEHEQRSVSHNDVRGICAAPVLVGGELVGFSALMTMHRSRSWTEKEQREIELVSELLVQSVNRLVDRNELRAAEVRARRIAEHVPVGLVMTDTRGRITFASSAFHDAFGVGEAGVGVGGSLTKIVHADDRALIDDALDRHRSGCETVRIHQGDDVVYCEVSWRFVSDSDSMDEYVFTLTDVNDTRRTIERFARQNRIDPLTGIANRRGHQHALSELDGSAGISVAFVDVDHFKTINDEHGHAAGDAALVAVADALSTTLGPSDVASRLGGDEFCIVMTSPRRADVLGESVIDAVRRTMESRELAVTVSVGVAGPLPARAIDELSAEADRLMYEAKASGGDRCMVADHHLDELARAAILGVEVN